MSVKNTLENELKKNRKENKDLKKKNMLHKEEILKLRKETNLFNQKENQNLKLKPTSCYVQCDTIREASCVDKENRYFSTNVG